MFCDKSVTIKIGNVYPCGHVSRRHVTFVDAPHVTRREGAGLPVCGKSRDLSWEFA